MYSFCWTFFFPPLPSQFFQQKSGLSFNPLPFQIDSRRNPVFIPLGVPIASPSFHSFFFSQFLRPLVQSPFPPPLVLFFHVAVLFSSGIFLSLARCVCRLLMLPPPFPMAAYCLRQRGFLFAFKDFFRLRLPPFSHEPPRTSVFATLSFSLFEGAFVNL